SGRIGEVGPAPPRVARTTERTRDMSCSQWIGLGAMRFGRRGATASARWGEEWLSWRPATERTRGAFVGRWVAFGAGRAARRAPGGPAFRAGAGVLWFGAAAERTTARHWGQAVGAPGWGCKRAR